MSNKYMNHIASYKYIEDVKQQEIGRTIKYQWRYLKTEPLLTVPYNKNRGFCFLKEEKYRTKLEDMGDRSQFSMITQN